MTRSWGWVGACIGAAMAAPCAEAAPTCAAPDWAPKPPAGYEITSCDTRVWAESTLSLADADKTISGERRRVVMELKEEAHNLDADAARQYYERAAAAAGAKLVSSPGGYGAVFFKADPKGDFWYAYDHGSGNAETTGSFTLTTWRATPFPQVVEARPFGPDGLQSPGKTCGDPPWLARNLSGFHAAACDYRDFDSVTFDLPDGPRTLAGRVLTTDYAAPDGADPIVAAMGSRNFADAFRKLGATIMSDPADVYSAYATFKAGAAEYWLLYRQAGGNEDDNTAFRVTTVQIGGPPPKACTLEVYGVNFDFDKATLREDSRPVLDQVLALFVADPAYAAEIGGHTDNVGAAGYNLKLSGARADALKAWLVAHGVDGKRVASRGYGDTRPIASNATDEGRAKNRRVELKRAKCGT